MVNGTNKNINAYSAQASQLATSYNSLATPDIFSDFTTYVLSLPDRSSMRVLDMGCGSGRDAFWIAQQGITVDAVDGARAMLDEARATHAHPLIHYIQDTAPALPALHALGHKYDVVLMSAFLFHFNGAERQAFYKALVPLLQSDSYFYVTLRHGPVPIGRVMHHVPLQELEDFAKAHNGASQYLGLKDDPLKRPNVCWDHVSLHMK